MTREEREETKKILKEKRFEINTRVNGETIFSKALDFAIEVLEQEPCGDAISREDALQALCKAVHKNDDTIPCLNQRVSCLWDKTKVQDYAEEILKLPSVTPTEKVRQWIPVSERLPEYEKLVLTWDGVTYNVEQRIPFIYGENGEEIENEWWVGADYIHEEGYYPDLRDGAAIAWMPLPEPYKANPTGAESEG